MAIKTDTFSSAGGGGAGTDNLDDVTSRGATTTNAITVGGVTVGTEYSLPTLDGSENQVLQTNGTGTVSFATLDFTGGLEYKGAFNATAGTPSLLNAEKGDFYIIDTAGTIYGQTWAVGDHLLINEDMGGTITNSKIDKIDNTQAVTSVNTQTGAVVISGNDVAADHTAVNYTAGNANVDGHLSGIDTKLGTLGTASTQDVGTSANNVVQLDGTAKLPAVDGSQLTNLPSASPASETVAGIIEIATNAEATAGTATDKALVPSNISSLDLSVMDNTTSAFITVGDIPTASHSTAGILETATNAEAANASANDKILTPANLSHIDLSTFDNDEGFISNITNESLNDLSDVSFTAGPGIDNYVLTYDNGTSSWGAEVVPSAPVTSVNTLTGAVVVSGNDIAADHTAVNYTAGNANVDGHLSGIDTKFGTLGTASTQDVGTSANNVVQLDGTSRLPAVDGSQLTNLPSAPVTSVNTLTGAVVVSGNDIAADHTATNYTAGNANVDGHLSGIDTKFGTLGTASTQDVGTSANNVVQLDGTSRLPAVDGSQLTNLPSAPVTSVNTQTGAVVVSGNDILADHTAVNYTASNNNVDGHFSGVDTKLGTLLADITSESLNDLSDVSFTAGAGIDNYVLTYDNSTTSWGAEAVPSASPASETTAGIIEIATNAEATAGTATDKALVPSNLSSVDLSVLDNTTSAFITAGDIPTASETVAGVIEIATNAEAGAGTATDKALVPSNISSLDLSAMDNTTSGFISGITSESLNDLSDVSFTAGAGIDNYVLTYDHATTSWGAEASAGGGYTYSAITADPANAQYDYHYSCTGTFTVTLPASASGDAGKEIRIKNMGTGTITVDGNASETIDGQTTIALDVRYSSITLIATGNSPAAWEIV